MKIYKFWMLAVMMAVSLVAISCGDDEANDEYGEEEDKTMINTEYTATTKVKEAKLEEARNCFDAYCVVYVDFNYKYALNLRDGYLALEPFSRKEGKWKIDYDNSIYGYLHSKNCLAAIKDLGKLNGIADIMEKNTTKNCEEIALMAQPQHGYAMCFKTENNEWRYLRVYIKGYTLDNEEALSSINVQYQLY